MKKLPIYAIFHWSFATTAHRRMGFMGTNEVKHFLKVSYFPRGFHGEIQKTRYLKYVWRSKRALSACYDRRNCSMETSHKSVKGRFWYKGQDLVWSLIGGEVSWYCVRLQNVIKHSRERNFVLFDKIPVSTKTFLNDDFKRSWTHPCSRSLFESLVALKIKHSYEEQAIKYHLGSTKDDQKYLHESNWWDEFCDEFHSRSSRLIKNKQNMIKRLLR